MKELIPNITCRESQVLHLTAYEHSSKEIAGMLCGSHRKNMMDKLRVRNTAGLIRVAFGETSKLNISLLGCVLLIGVDNVI